MSGDIKVEIISEPRIYDVERAPLAGHPDLIRVDVCVKCGAVVWDVIQHDGWHRANEPEDAKPDDVAQPAGGAQAWAAEDVVRHALEEMLGSKFDANMGARAIVGDLRAHGHLTVVPETESTREELIYPPLTSAQFAQGCGYTFHGVPLAEDEHGNYVYAYGHVRKALFAQAVNDYDREFDSGAETQYTSDDVRHCYAVTLRPPWDPDGWHISWEEKHQGHDARFALTVINR